MPTIVCCMVSRNHEATIERAVRLTASELVACDGELWVRDNGSTDHTVELLKKLSLPYLDCDEKNLGFCAANNHLLNRALEKGAEYVLFLNPDAAPAPGSLTLLIEALKNDRFAGAATPKILRAGGDLSPLSPPIIDAAGMFFTAEFRHLDRGSGERDIGQYESAGYMAGGTGAALLVKRSCIESASFRTANGALEFFDERFFAYREDAELALRLWRFGLKTLYLPTAVFYHVRRVLPERRAALPQELNRLSVRNRFFLQQSHLTSELPLGVHLAALWRNCLVLGAVLIRERSSLSGLREYLLQRRSGKLRRAEIQRKTIASSAALYARTPYIERRAA